MSLYVTDKSKWQVGDRVVCVKTYPPGLRKGDTGTVVRADVGKVLIVHWDEYVSARHSASCNVPDGHGWYLHDESEIALLEPEDLGEINLKGADISCMFGTLF